MSDASLTAPAIGRERTLPKEIWGFSRPQLLGLAVMVALIVSTPFVLYPIFLMKLMCFALFACAFNLLIGYVGLLSFGHAVYFGIGAYFAGYAATMWAVSPVVSILGAAAAAALLGTAFGWLAIRRSGIYFAMITLALAQMIYFVFVQAPMTGGENGMQDIPRGTLFGVVDLSDDMTMYWTVAAIFLAGFLIIHRIVRSPFGQVLKAIRENEPRAISLGYRTENYKLIAFVLSATFAGVAGATKALAFGIATLPDAHWSTSGEVVLMGLVGGLGTMFGPVVGAAVIVSMQNYLAEFGDWVAMSQAVIFIACVLAFRKGIVGEIGSAFRVKL